MPKTKRKRSPNMKEATAVVLGLGDMVDALFVRYTGRTVKELIMASVQRTEELPAGEKTPPVEIEREMPLADAYAVLGLKPDASLADVKKSYRNLASFYHSDRGNVMNDEAMKLLNRAYDSLTKKKGEGG